MAFGHLDPSNEDSELSEINMVPLIDVMLVLLIVFMVTLPMLQQAVKLELPQASAQPVAESAETVRLAIDAQGQYHWDAERVSDAVFAQRCAEWVRRGSQVVLHVRADKRVPYERVAQAMAAAQQAGVGKIGLVTQP